MTCKYRENRARNNQSMDSMIADIMRHFHARQHLGTAAIITPDPHATLLLATKQWAKLSRALQRRRSRNNNPIEILKYTYTIASMQHLVMSARTPEQDPGAQLYVLYPHQLGQAGLPFTTIYATGPLNAAAVQRAATSLMASGLLVDYSPAPASASAAHNAGLFQPRSELEQAAAQAWEKLLDFLAGQNIQLRDTLPLVNETMDDAVDHLLGMDVTFLAQAAVFQRALDLARPLINTPKRQRDQYEAFIMLAHRVQTFASTGFSSQFLHTYASDDFWLGDRRFAPAAELLVQIQHHLGAQRYNVVRALRLQLAAARS